MVRTVVVAALSAVLLSAGSPAGADSPTRDHLGGCGFLPSTEPTPGDTVGTLYVAAVVYSTAEPAANPVTATVTCEIRVDGVAVGSLVATGTGVVAALDDEQVVVREGIEYQACATVAYDNGETDGPDCDPDRVSIPPEAVNEAIEDHVDPPICAAFARLVPGVPGVVDVTPDGDVYLVAWGFFWDCPPYDPGSPPPPDTGTRQHVGRCGWTSALEETHSPTADGWWGHLSTATVVYSATDQGANPVSATVTCSLRGVEVEGGPYSFSGTGVVAGISPPFRFFGEGPPEMDVCTRVEYDNGEVDEACVPRTTTQVPPDEVLDPLVEVFTTVDSTVCPVIAAQAPGVPGVVDIDAEGDVYLVAWGLLWDCPPYQGLS